MDMRTPAYQLRRGEIETYFDRTAVAAWEKLTSTAPVGRIRATVRHGRDLMRGQLLGWLPDDLRGLRLLDAGCGTGALAVEAARRGAQVLAIDLSPTLVALAKARLPADVRAGTGPGCIDFRSGDMLDPVLGHFDHIVAMDSLIHYDADDVTRVLGAWAGRCHGSMAFTFAPRTPLLAAMHRVGKLFPRSDRSPAIVPVGEQLLYRRLGSDPAMQGWQPHATRRVSVGFYTSQAWQWTRRTPLEGVRP
jgi:magnesium-protoporphyrin O-methyltransferase